MEAVGKAWSNTEGMEKSVATLTILTMVARKYCLVGSSFCSCKTMES